MAISLELKQSSRCVDPALTLRRGWVYGLLRSRSTQEGTWAIGGRPPGSPTGRGWGTDPRGREALEEAFLRHGPPKHIITDQEGVFTSEVFGDLLWRWNVKQRFGAVGRHGSIAVTERVIRTLKYEWLRRVPVIRGLDHLEILLAVPVK